MLGNRFNAGMVLACSSSEVPFQGIVWSPGGGALTAVCCALALVPMFLWDGLKDWGRAETTDPLCKLLLLMTADATHPRCSSITLLSPQNTFSRICQIMA